MGSGIKTEAAEANLPFGQLVVRSLALLGVEHFVVSPGSRSTPLSLAVEELEEDRWTVVLDERSAGFRALGRIKASGRPAAVLCTSGSAAAHYFPAVIEAREAGLPLVVLTADRPPELRHCHAGQTIDQQKLYGTYPVYAAELPLPATDNLLLRQVREVCRVAVEAAMGSPSGPVHLNCPFREPFIAPGVDPVPLAEELLSGLHPVQRNRAGRAAAPCLPEHTVILAGPVTGMEDAHLPAGVAELARASGFPILADGSHPLRHAPDAAGLTVIHYDRIARREDLWKELQPEAAILIGEPPTSKALREALAALDLPGYLVGPGKQAINPVHGKVQWLGDSVESLLDIPFEAASCYRDCWLDADREMEQRLAGLLDRPHDLFEGDIHRALAEELPEGAPVVYASSLAIRDADWFMPRTGKRLRPISQRGANGIDGTVSLARGVANALGQPTWLVTGDLAFLHDGNGLANLSAGRDSLFVVLINNHGGGIFEMLPVAHRSRRFEDFYATPQRTDIAQLVRAHGGGHAVCPGIDEFRQALRDWDGQGLMVAEIPVDRKLSKELHRNLILLENE